MREVTFSGLSNLLIVIGSFTRIVITEGKHVCVWEMMNCTLDRVNFSCLWDIQELIPKKSYIGNWNAKAWARLNKECRKFGAYIGPICIECRQWEKKIYLIKWAKLGKFIEGFELFSSYIAWWAAMAEVGCMREETETQEVGTQVRKLSNNWEQWFWPANSKNGGITVTQRGPQAKPPFRASWVGANMWVSWAEPLIRLGLWPPGVNIPGWTINSYVILFNTGAGERF